MGWAGGEGGAGGMLRCERVWGGQVSRGWRGVVWWREGGGAVGGRGAGCDGVLQALQLPLRTRYGLPISTKSRQDMVPGSIDLKWGFRRMTVLLQMVDGRTVDLTYSANLPVRPGGL